MNNREKLINEKIQALIDSLMELRTYLITDWPKVPIYTEAPSDPELELLKNPHIIWTKAKPTFDFEAIYRQYPRKLGKANGIKRLKAQIKTQEQYEDLKRSLANFNKYHRINATEPAFIPYFSTYVTIWTDWLAADTGTSKIPNTSSESTSEYLARREKERQKEEEWSETDPQKVKEIIAKALGKKTH